MGSFFCYLFHNILIMGRKVKKCCKKCQNHLFLLKPVHYSAAFSRELQSSFCPSSVAGPSVTPKFNRDKRHYTISFILPVDYKKLQKNQEFNKIDHQRHRLEINEQKSKILIAKPTFKSSYCNVCQAQYQDYLEHIRSEDHKNGINKNKFNQFINEICDQMQIKVKEEEFRQQQGKVIHSFQTNTFLQSTQFENTIMEKSYSFLFPNVQYKKCYPLFNNNNENISYFPQFKQHHHNFQMNHQDQQIQLAIPQLSPAKRQSEVTQCLKIMPQIKINKPIILCGGNFLKFE